MWNRFCSKFIHSSVRFKVPIVCFSSDATVLKNVKIGNVSKAVNKPANPELVPINYLRKECSKDTIAHLQWLMKKDLLGQDVFLIGLPGPTRRRLILQYAELMQQEVEYITLSRDTTESDLKQRREIVSGTAVYKDQSAIEAALNGRILVLDGVEKAERNILPILNNLLENREVQLEDGRFLISAERYDKLLLESTAATLDSWRLVRVSEKFRVVALGLPVPLYRGHPLDPPFRSRFQARDIQPSYEEQLKEFASMDNDSLSKILTLCQMFSTEECSVLGIPKFPVENIRLVAQILESVPHIPSSLLLEWTYPYNLFLHPEAKKYVEHQLKNLKITQSVKPRNFRIHEGKPLSLAVTVHGRDYHLKLDQVIEKDFINPVKYVENQTHNSLLSDMLLTHLSHDFCLVGSKGSGKTTLIKKFATLIQQPWEMVMLYKDMTARDLIQQRTTDKIGNTVWKPSVLVQSALSGKLLILDGLHRLHQSTLSILHSLIHDRELQLFDGSRLLRHDRYDAIKQKFGFSDTLMQQRNIYRIDPRFRIVALAEPPTLRDTKNQWLTPEVLSMFLFHNVQQLSFAEEKLIIEKLVGPISEKMDIVLNFAHTLHESNNKSLSGIGDSLSTRQLIRIAQRLAEFPHQDIYSLISQACLMKFLPRLTRESLETALENAGIIKEENIYTNRNCTVKDGIVHIGSTSTPVHNPGKSKVKVPDILFYNTIEHISIMESMLQDFVLGEHLLLIGNQGVGKNKIVDRFLQLLNYPREYIQLHRDTTVQSLTQIPNVVDNCIVYEDSPLVKAVQNGYVLVVDEADKAPTHVTSILKALVESGEMVLSDGRSIVNHDDPRAGTGGNNVIAMHPDFRMIVLANRPGFPFLGNDFFATMGDIFSCYAVENPSLESEISMLHNYGPNVPAYILEKLVQFFGELRSFSDSGIISYPYSTREVVNIVKHLEKFPNDGLPLALRSVFDFDAHNSQLKETLLPVFHKHGIPFGSPMSSIKLAKAFDLPAPKQLCQLFSNSESTHVASIQNLKLSSPHQLHRKQSTLDCTVARADTFSEQLKYWRLPIDEHDAPLDLAVTCCDDHSFIYVVTGNPISLLSINASNNMLSSVNLSDLFPPIRRGFRPKIKLSALGDSLEDHLFIYEKFTNQAFLLSVASGRVTEICMANPLTQVKEKLSKMLSAEAHPKLLNICSDYAHKNLILFYSSLSGKITAMDLNKLKEFSFEIPDTVKLISAVDDTLLFVKGNQYVFFVDVSDFENWKVVNFGASDKMSDAEAAMKMQWEIDVMYSILAVSGDKALSVLSRPGDYAAVMIGDPMQEHEISVWNFPRQFYEHPYNTQSVSAIMREKNSQIIRLMSVDNIAPNFSSKELSKVSDQFLEVTDLNSLKVSYVPITLPTDASTVAKWLTGTSDPYLLIAPLKSKGFVTVDAKGYIRIWETVQGSIENSLQEWFKVTGVKEDEQLTIQRENAPDVTAPKHGKVDPTGAPHVGGNTWAGGTGGRDTAGLGGKGGPYRLDAGHNVFQLPDSEKDAVPPEVKKAAREMAIKAYQDRLKEIQMSEYDAEMYESIYGNVKKQVNILRTILDGLQARSKERQWLKHQTSGELDDTRLIEGITGEKNIYRKRGEEEPELGSPQEKPKKLRLLVDVSGSMYRFNGHDKRLERELESVILVMEAFDGYQDRFQYDIVGHSGEDFCIPFTQFDKPPQNNKERLEVLKKMHAHSQFCISGDNTLRATKHAIENIAKEEADEHFVIVMSDANFDRYGISPKSLSSLLLSDPKVNSFALFIGTLGDQASRLQKQLPSGRGFICFDMQQLPQILQQIFTSALLRET